VSDGGSFLEKENMNYYSCQSKMRCFYLFYVFFGNALSPKEKKDSKDATLFY
jgi:hypothetical protein